MTMKKFVFGAVIPLAGFAVLCFLLRPFCLENGECNYWKLLFLAGVPFGVRRMWLWLIPKNFDIGGTAGVWIINILIGGMIGSVILIWQMLMAILILLWGCGYGLFWITGGKNRITHI